MALLGDRVSREECIVRRSILLILTLALAAASPVAAGMFERTPIAPESGIEVLTRDVAQAQTGRALLANPFATVTISHVDVYDRFPHVEARDFQIVSDPRWNRLIFGERGRGVHAYDGRGPGAIALAQPRGMAVDERDRVYVADTGNDRIQKFDSEGKFVALIGDPGEREGKMKEPNGVAVDAEGNLYVTDAGNHKFLKYNPEGTFVKEYNGPDTGFYGPRDIAIGTNNQLYIVDQGRTRIARFQPVSEAFSLTWGVSGSNEREFRDATGIGIGDNLVFVTDLGNGRIQVFDLDGNFVRQWPITTWERSSSEFPDVLFDAETRTVYVTSPRTNEVLAFDENGTPKQGFNPQDDQKLESPASMTILTANKKRWLLVVSSGSNKVSKFELEAAIKTDKTDNTNKVKK